MARSGGVAPCPWYLTRLFDDADDLARSLKAAGVIYLPLAAGPYAARLTLIGFGGMVLQRASNQAHVVRGAIAPDAVSLVFPLRFQATPTVNGWRTDGTDGVLLGPGTEVHALCPGDVDWASLAMPVETARRIATRAGLGGVFDQPGRVLRVTGPALDGLRQATIAATDAVAEAGQDARALWLATALSVALEGHLLAAFAHAEIASVHRATREAIRLVDSAEALLQAHPDRPFLTNDLCAALAVCPRRLHKAFVAAAGISPQAYLRRRRLMMVHAALKDGGGDAGLVKSVALSHGFWHLGHFARSYREQFGQAPSETLAAARIGRYHGAAIPRSPHAAARQDGVGIG